MARRSFGDADVASSELLQNLARNLKAIKEERGLAFHDFAKLIDVSPRHLTEILGLRTNVTLLVVEVMAARLTIPADRLISAGEGDFAEVKSDGRTRRDVPAKAPPDRVGVDLHDLHVNLLVTVDRLCAKVEGLTDKIGKNFSETVHQPPQNYKRTAGRS